MLTFKEVNKVIQEHYPNVQLVQGKGYLYITSDDEETATWIAGMYTTSIPVCKLNHFKNVNDVLRSVTNLIKTDQNESYSEHQRKN